MLNGIRSVEDDLSAKGVVSAVKLYLNPVIGKQLIPGW